MNRILDHAKERIFSFIFPRDAFIQRIENMSPSDFENLAAKADLEIALPFPVHSFFSYKDPLVSRAIRELKYRKNERVAELFAETVCYRLTIELEDETSYTNFIDPVIVPIPTHPRKKKAKGFNQTELILEKLKKISPYDIHDALRKIRDTSDQTHKNRKERLQNIKNSFKLREGMSDIIRGRNVIVFDDVVTTGGTLLEAFRVLKKAKTRRIVGVTLAH